MQKVISNISEKITTDTFLNIFFFLIIVFSKNYLEEDLILGLFSSIVLFLIFFFFKEEKKQGLREFRLNVKKIYRIQKDLLSSYYSYYRLLQRRYFKYTKNFIKKFFLFKLSKSLMPISFKLKNFLSKLIFIKSFTLNLLINLILKENINILSIC